MAPRQLAANRFDSLPWLKSALAKASADNLRCPKIGLSTDSGSSREGWWAWEDLNFRPHAYQARALTT